MFPIENLSQLSTSYLIEGKLNLPLGPFVGNSSNMVYI